MKKLKLFILPLCLFSIRSFAATVVANVNGVPITDTDITARTQLMNKQGQVSTANRRQALSNIIDDNIKLAYAKNFNAIPDDKVVEKEVQNMNLGELTASETAMALSATKANIAWQIVVARTVLPLVDITPADISKEKNTLEKEHGLPIEMTIVRLIDIPAEIAQKLTKPKDCDDAVAMAENLGGVPQKFTALEYELSADIRERVAGLPLMTWSPIRDGSVLLVCKTQKTAEYGKLDEVIKQNALYKQALFMADQQLKQLRRKAVIIINDDRYKL